MVGASPTANVMQSARQAKLLHLREVGSGGSSLVRDTPAFLLARFEAESGSLGPVPGARLERTSWLKMGAHELLVPCPDTGIVVGSLTMGVPPCSCVPAPDEIQGGWCITMTVDWQRMIPYLSSWSRFWGAGFAGAEDERQAISGSC